MRADVAGLRGLWNLPVRPASPLTPQMECSKVVPVHVDRDAVGGGELLPRGDSNGVVPATNNQNGQPQPRLACQRRWCGPPRPVVCENGADHSVWAGARAGAHHRGWFLSYRGEPG